MFTHRLSSCVWRRYQTTLLALVCLLSVSHTGWAQPPGQPILPYARLFTVTPPGGKLGSTVEVTIGGVDLEEVFALYFSHPGLKAAGIPDPMKPGSFLANKFTVTIAPDVAIGAHDVRAIGKYGISNPRAFVVGDLTEELEKEANNDVPQAQKIEVNSTVSGAINPNVDVDYYLFAGKKGQRLLIHCAAFSIDSRMDPYVEVRDASGKQLASNRRYQERDAFLECVLPADGDYNIRVCEHTHLTGGPEHFYRLTLSVTPWIDAAYPPVVEPGKPSKITLYGRNLPNGQPDPQTTVDGKGLDKLEVEVKPPADPLSGQRMMHLGNISPATGVLDGFEYRVKNAAGTSNPVLLTYATGPITLDSGDNDTPEKAQAIAAPGDVCGMLEKKKDRDWYVFTAKANEVFVIETYAKRLGVPMDFYFELYRVDDKNRQLINLFDENPDLILHTAKFNTRTDDPKTRFVAPADGKYLLMVGSELADLYAGPRYVYRVNLRKEQPDFRLVLMDNIDGSPAGSFVRQSGTQYLDVFCFRNDGFTSEVTLTVEGLPPGLTCPPQTLGPNLKQTALAITAAEDASPWAGEIKIKGTATINGQAVVREARGACTIWPSPPQQPNLPAFSRLSRSICLAVTEKGQFSLEAETPELAAPVGAPIVTKIKINRLSPDFKAPVPLSFVAQPVMPNQPQPQLPVVATIAADKSDAEIRLNLPNNLAPGVYNLVVRGFGQFQYSKDPMAKQKQNVNALEAATPIKLVVYNTVAELTVSEPNLKLKPGTETEVTVKVNRLNGYKGEYKVQLVLPQGFQGVTAAEVTIPADADEAKLTLKVPDNAKPANNPNLVVRAIATVDKITLNHDAKVAVEIESK